MLRQRALPVPCSTCGASGVFLFFFAPTVPTAALQGNVCDAQASQTRWLCDIFLAPAAPTIALQRNTCSSQASLKHWLYGFVDFFLCRTLLSGRHLRPASNANVKAAHQMLPVAMSRASQYATPLAAVVRAQT